MTRNLRHRIVTLAGAAIIAAAGQPRAAAQIVSGDLVGTVTDSTGAAVPGATVGALNVSTGINKTTATNESGLYRISNLPGGQYKITASAAGFAAAALNAVQIDVNKVATINVTLQLGQVSTTVDVQEAAANIDTTTAAIQNTFDAQAARDLPVTSIGLGSANLALLNAGVGSNGGIGVGEGPSVGGQRPYNNNFMVEGVDNNNKTVTGSLLRTIPNDAVAEFTALQNQSSAEFGHSSGGQFNTIIKSGTNQLHGTFYEYLQNRNLNAIDQQAQNAAISTGTRPKNPRFDSNRFGASVGGPIRKDKLFYFGDYEYNPVGQAQTLASGIVSPTAAGYGVLATLPGLSQTNFSILKQYLPAAPLATQTITTATGLVVPVGTPNLPAPNYQNNSAGVASADYNISDKDALRGRILYNKLSNIDIQAPIPAFFTQDTATYYIGTVSEYHNFTPRLVNELRLGYNRLNQTFPAGNFKYPGLDLFPEIHIGDLGIILGANPNAPQFSVQNMYQIADNLSWTWKNHTLKFGVDGRKFIAPSSFTQRARGDYEYSSVDIFLKDLQPDSLAERGIGNVVFYGDQVAVYSYVNDTWRLKPNLTVNLGLRHEFTSVPFGERLQTLNSLSNVPGLLEFKKPEPQWRNFAPRVGLAYSPGNSGKTSIRAGFGMAYDVIFDNIGQLSLPPQLSTTADDANNGNPLQGRPNFLAHGGILPNAAVGALTAADARANTAGYIPNQKLPYSINWNFGIQHVFLSNYTFEARYLGTRGVHLDVQSRINVLSRVSPSRSLPTFLTAPSQSALDSLPLTLADLQGSRLVPAFKNAGFTRNVVENNPIGNSSYNGLALQLNRRFSNGMQFVGAYTWSHLIDDSTADFFTTLLTPRRAQDFQNMRAERSSSALDRRQRLTFAMVYEVPWFKNSNWFLKNLLGNWEVAPVYTFESPEYITPQSQLDSNLNGDAFGDRTIVNPAGIAGVGSGVTPLCRTGTNCDPTSDAFSSANVVGYLANNPKARYIVAGAGAYATGGRNTLAGRRINNWDMNFLKNFSVRERLKLQVSAQAFNLFNHAQFIPGFTNRADNPVNLNTGGAVWNYLTPGNPIFNNPEAVYSSSPRVIQIAAKIVF